MGNNIVEKSIKSIFSSARESEISNKNKSIVLKTSKPRVRRAEHFSFEKKIVIRPLDHKIRDSSYFGSYMPGKLRGTRHNSRNSAVQSNQPSWTGQYKKGVQYDFKFTPVY